MEPGKRVANSSIRMGEMSVASDGELLRTLLGSCIGLALYDRRRQVGGLAHIVFTRDANGNATLYVNGESKHAQAMQGDFSNWHRGYPAATIQRCRLRVYESTIRCVSR